MAQANHEMHTGLMFLRFSEWRHKAQHATQQQVCGITVDRLMESAAEVASTAKEF